jgi:hypothetical protein
LPIEATVMSSFCPGFAKGGSSAVQRLDGIFEIVVPRARQPNDDAIAGELVRADALEPAQVLDAVRRGGGREEEQAERGEEKTDHARHPAPDMVTKSFTHQNGLTTEKKRLSHPCRPARATSPLPV